MDDKRLGYIERSTAIGTMTAHRRELIAEVRRLRGKLDSLADEIDAYITCEEGECAVCDWLRSVEGKARQARDWEPTT